MESATVTVITIICVFAFHCQRSGTSFCVVYASSV